MQWFAPLVFGLLLCLGLPACQGASWTYTGQHGVDHWATDYPGQCDGQRQSPINLASTSVTYQQSLSNDPFVFTNFDTTSGVTWDVQNNGHTLQVNVGGSSALQVTGGSLGSGKTYQVAQFHFHWGSDNTQGSEHTINSAPYPMEMHIVTFNTAYTDLNASLGHSDGLAVLGFFLEISSNTNPNLDTLVNVIPNITTSNTTVQGVTPVALDDIMGSTSDFYRYSGGLTTPPCTEVVTWTVFTHTIKISSGQLQEFRTLKDSNNSAIVNNYRPVQSLNSRSITSSFDISRARSLAFSGLFLIVAVLLSLGIRA